MSTRRLDDIPEDAKNTLLAVLDTARNAATSGIDDEDLLDLYEEAEDAHPVPRTGTKLARVAAAAGATAAHVLRLDAESGPRPAGEPWTQALIDAGPAINAWDWDQRMRAALDLRATFIRLPTSVAEPAAATLRPVRLVAAWLTNYNDAALIPAGARLAELALNQTGDTGVWSAPWYAVNGMALVDLVAKTGTTTEGRPTAAERIYRDRLRRAVVGVHDAGLHRRTPKDVYDRGGITYATWRAWTKPVQEER